MRTIQPIDLLTRNIDEAFEGPAWHGPSLMAALRDVDATSAVWRPHPDRHCIWELALHAAYWKYIVRRRIAGGLKRGSFPRKGSNFPAMPDRADAGSWAADLALLREQHDLLKEAAAQVPARMLEDRPGTDRWTVRQHLLGAAAHDVYHAGQIQLLKKLQSTG
jgi:hypothetical protein